MILEMSQMEQQLAMRRQLMYRGIATPQWVGTNGNQGIGGKIRDEAVKFGGVRHHNNCVMEASHMRQAVQHQLLTPLDKCTYISLFQGKKFFVDICFRHEGLFSEATFKDIAQLETVNNNSVVVQLTDDGSMSARDLREGKNLVKNVKKKFPVGSAHPCHVVGLDWVGGVAVCSLHKSLLSGVMRIDELVVDSAVSATVEKFMSSGLVVDVGPHLSHFIQPIIDLTFRCNTWRGSSFPVTRSSVGS